MDKRKVQLTGGSSFIVTLPKKWTKAQNIEQGQEIGFIYQGDGRYRRSPESSGERNDRRSPSGRGFLRREPRRRSGGHRRLYVSTA